MSEPKSDSSNDGFVQRLAIVEEKFATRKEAAAAAKIAQSTFQRWAEGKAVPNFHGVASLAKAAGVSLDWLAFGVGQAPDGTMAVSAAQCGADEAVMTEIYLKIQELVQGHSHTLSPEQHIAFTCNVYNKVMGKPDDRNEIIASGMDLLVIMLKGLKPSEAAPETPAGQRSA